MAGSAAGLTSGPDLSMDAGHMVEISHDFSHCHFVLISMRGFLMLLWYAISG